MSSRIFLNIFVGSISLGFLFFPAGSEASHPSEHMPITDICYKAALHFLNNESLSAYSGIPNPPQVTTAEELRTSSAETCIAYLDGATEGTRIALGFELFPEFCRMIRTEGLGAYASQFMLEGWTSDFGRRQAHNLAIACDHALLRGQLRTD